MKLKTERWLLAALVALAAATPLGASADPGEDVIPLPSARGPYLRVDVGVSVFGGVAWSTGLGWHASSSLALHATAWGVSYDGAGWGAYVYQDHVDRFDAVAGGLGATLRHDDTQLFVSASGGLAFLRARRGRPEDYDVHRDAGVAATLRIGREWFPDEWGPALGISVGGTYLHPLTNAGEWPDHGFHVDLALTVATR